jgi:hypothetical protein
LDVERTAGAIGVRLTFLPRLEAMGYCLGRDEIELDCLLDPPRLRVVFAHEVGHLLIRRGRVSRGLRSDETLADQLGDEMAAPSDELEKILPVTPTEAAEIFGIPPARAAAQLARLGVIPPWSRLESGEVVCARCGDRESLECRCLYYRVNRHEASSLPLAG